MDGRMFEGLFTGLILFGVVIGLALAGLGWLGYWLWTHISFAWS